MKDKRRMVRKTWVHPVKAGRGQRAIRSPEEFRSIHKVFEQETITLQDVRWVARAVGGSQEAVEHFMSRRFVEFDDLTPEEMTNRGRGKEVVGVLLNVAEGALS